MRLRKKIQIDVITEIAGVLGRGIANLSDGAMIKALRALRGIAPDKGTRDSLDELIEAIKSGPPNTNTLRRMLRESRKDEIRELIEGTFFFDQMDCENMD